MAQYYYIDPQGKQIGPVEKSVLVCLINSNTMVWCEGMAAWTPAAQVAELAGLLQPGMPPAPAPVYQQQQQQYYAPQQQQQPPYEKPSSHMTLGILSTIFCCLAFGIVSIVYASKVDGCWARGEYDEAYDNSRKANNWGIAAIVCGLVFSVGYFILMMAAGFAL